MALIFTPQHLSDDHIINLRQLAELLGVAERTLRRIPASELPIRKITARRVGVTMGDYRRFVAQRDRLARKTRDPDDATAA